MRDLLVPTTRAVDVRQEGERVLLIERGRTLLDLPYDAALELARAIVAQARAAEEIAKATGIITDTAILMRAGAPFALTSNRAMLSQARNDAAWESSLRRYMPGGVRSREVFGAPTIIKHRGDDHA